MRARFVTMTLAGILVPLCAGSSRAETPENNFGFYTKDGQPVPASAFQGMPQQGTPTSTPTNTNKRSPVPTQTTSTSNNTSTSTNTARDAAIEDFLAKQKAILDAQKLIEGSVGANTSVGTAVNTATPTATATATDTDTPNSTATQPRTETNSKSTAVATPWQNFLGIEKEIKDVVLPQDTPQNIKKYLKDNDPLNNPNVTIFDQIHRGIILQQLKNNIPSPVSNPKTTSTSTDTGGPLGATSPTPPSSRGYTHYPTDTRLANSSKPDIKIDCALLRTCGSSGQTAASAAKGGTQANALNPSRTNVNTTSNASSTNIKIQGNAGGTIDFKITPELIASRSVPTSTTSNRTASSSSLAATSPRTGASGPAPRASTVTTSPSKVSMVAPTIKVNTPTVRVATPTIRVPTPTVRTPTVQLPTVRAPTIQIRIPGR